MSEYSNLMDKMYGLAEQEGADNLNVAWLYIDDAYWWPNPHYTGESVAHPECATEFHPTKGPSVKERFKRYKESNT